LLRAWWSWGRPSWLLERIEWRLGMRAYSRGLFVANSSRARKRAFAALRTFATLAHGVAALFRAEGCL
jgi:hypothetical protein